MMTTFLCPTISTAIRSSIPLRSFVMVVSILLALPVPAVAIQVDGFTEPYRTIDIAAAETGIIAEINVEEGDTVRRGQVLAVLDRDVLLALLAIAEQGMHSRAFIAEQVAHAGNFSE